MDPYRNSQNLEIETQRRFSLLNVQMANFPQGYRENTGTFGKRPTEENRQKTVKLRGDVNRLDDFEPCDKWKNF